MNLHKAFNKLHSKITKECDSLPSEKPTPPPKSAEDELRARTGPMTQADCIPRILLAWSDKDYFRYARACVHVRAHHHVVRVIHGHFVFRLLGLPPVDVDALGRPTWECEDKDVSRAYRKLSLFVHPDRPANRNNEKAREAFERLNEAHRILLDPAKRADELSKRLEDAKARRAIAEANASVSERIALNAEKGSAVRFSPTSNLDAWNDLTNF
jgi:DnaJ domain